jgi:excisionase family DNA binding protein
MSYLGIGKAKIYSLLATGELGSFHIGRRRYILEEQLAAFIAIRVKAEDAEVRSKWPPNYEVRSHDTSLLRRWGQEDMKPRPPDQEVGCGKKRLG